ncbi:MAG: hypothetical protein V4671_24150, partial [Armatimonadota bacterium]
DGPSSTYPSAYVYHDPASPRPDKWTYEYWLATGSTSSFDFPPVATLDLLFKPIQDDKIFPLAVPVIDVFEGRNGWPMLPLRYTAFSENPPLTPEPLRKSLGVDLRIHDLVLARESGTGDIVASFTITNAGLTGASNVELTVAQLKSSQAINPPSRHQHLAPGQEREMRVRFPASVGAAGSAVVLRLSGQYLGGTYGGSFRVKVP